MVKKFIFLTIFSRALFCPSAVFCEEPAYLHGRVIVRFSDSVTAVKDTAGILAGLSMKVEKDLPFFSRLRKKPHSVLSSDLPVEKMLELLRKNPLIEYAQPVYIRRPMEVVPDDPMYARQWALPVIRAPYAWGESTGAGDVVVAVVDSGIDYTHPDIAPNMWINRAEFEGAEDTDDDGNGYTDDIFGYNFAAGSPDPMDTNTHGTHVAGIIGAAGNNSIGVAGVNWSAGLMALNAMTGGVFYDDDLIEAIGYAVIMKRDYGVNIVAVNASWGSKSGNDGDLLYQAILSTADAGIAFVAAAGNDGKNNDTTPLYPASYNLPNIIAVAASSQQDYLWTSTNYGANSVHLAAPGANILSTVPHSTYAGLSSAGDDYAAWGIEFAGVTGEEGITGMLVDCGSGYPGQIPPEAAGNIALIERGELYFSEKVSNAQSAGAAAAVIYNNIPDGEPGGGIINATLGSAGSWIPAVFISNGSGLSLKGLELPVESVLYNTVSFSSYAEKSGTSMAAPFVSGAIALLCSEYPGETVARNTYRVLAGVQLMAREEDRNNLITGGRLDLEGAFLQVLPLLGDINGDGEINISDVILCLRMALELEPADLLAGDLSGDWLVDIGDVILLLRKTVGLDP